MHRATAGPPHPLPHARQRLWLARAIAWALLLGGWLVLGTLGRQYQLQTAGGQVPVALWLATVGGALALSGRWRWSALALRSALLATGLAATAALALLAHSPAALLGAAPAWALLLVAASFAVRGLRRLQPSQPPAPIGPALAGACLAWVVAGDLDALRQGLGPVVLAPGLAALALALLLPAPSIRVAPGEGGRNAGFGGCQAGLFDCSLPLLQPGRWRHPATWPQAAAALTMLPMMASLPAMADWCGGLRWPAAAGTALHLGAMLLPAALLHGVGQPLRRPQPCLVLLLVLGGAALLMWPGQTGLMAAAGLHGLAWGVAWSALLTPRGERTDSAGRGASPAPSCTAPAGLAPGAKWGAALLTASAVLLLGQAMAQVGPAALAAVHAALAGLGLVGGFAGLLDPAALPQSADSPG